MEGVIWVTWPNKRPSTSPGEEEMRWINEARVGPEIAIFSNGGSSMETVETKREGGREGGFSETVDHLLSFVAKCNAVV